MIESLTKLAASKDIATYTALDTSSTRQYIHDEYAKGIIPMDDESVARRMMEAYAERGIDPSLAVSADSDASAIEDFGGPSAFH